MAGTAGVPAKDKLKLLVPTSFSRKSELALDFALIYSQNFNANVYLFHVFEEATKDYRRLDALNQEHMERMRQVVINAIDRMASRGVTHHLDEVHRRVSGGKPWLEILRMAAGVSCDMIIMGAPDTDDFKKLIRQAPCTLVLVREKDTSFVV
jgi:nucleotide-binding universal stress UspA family protein